MNAKAKGTRNEHRSMRLLEAAGYRCTRSAASLGEWDIIGIGSRTVHRWLQESDFQTAYLMARREIVRHTTSVLQQASARAVCTLIDVMEIRA